MNTASNDNTVPVADGICNGRMYVRKAKHRTEVAVGLPRFFDAYHNVPSKYCCLSSSLNFSMAYLSIVLGIFR